MKTDNFKTLAIAIGLALAVSTFSASAQDPGAAPSPGDSGSNGKGGDHPRPNPEQMASRLMEKFDTDKDGELSQEELTKALEALAKHRGPHGGPEKNKDGAAQGNTDAQPPTDPQGEPGGGHEHPPADKVAAHMIEKFSSDKKGLTQDELAKALEEHRKHRGEQHGGPGCKPPGEAPAAGANQ